MPPPRPTLDPQWLLDPHGLLDALELSEADPAVVREALEAAGFDLAAFERRLEALLRRAAEGSTAPGGP